MGVEPGDPGYEPLPLASNTPDADPYELMPYRNSDPYTPVPFASGAGREPEPFAPMWGGQGSALSQQNPVTERPRGQAISQGRNTGLGADTPAVSGADPNAKAGTPAGDAVRAYIIQAANARGIDPNIALRIAEHEGGLDKYEGNMGQFNTGRSHWAFQLHYGGKGTPYAAWGNTAGMGNDFTARTGYQPGDPAAWKAATDFALDHARRNGWGAWYGRGPAGVGEWDGIPR